MSAEQETRREQSRQQVEASVRALLTSEGWRQWSAVRARFRKYSFGNCALIAMQRPDATQVAGYRAWQALGRQVRKGERSIAIMAPMSVKRVREDGEEERVPFFRAVRVFDVSQTDGDELPAMPCEPIVGDSHAEYLPRLRAFAGTLGFTVETEDLAAGHGGYCDAQAKRIVVAAGAPINATVRTLVHELAHALGVGYKEYGREDAEVIVETAAVIVCGGIGLDTSGESIPYIASWGEDGDLAAIKRYAAKVDECARTLETALDA